MSEDTSGNSSACTLELYFSLRTQQYMTFGKEQPDSELIEELGLEFKMKVPASVGIGRHMTLDELKEISTKVMQEGVRFNQQVTGMELPKSAGEE